MLNKKERIRIKKVMKRCIRMEELFSDVNVFEIDDLTIIQQHNLMTFYFMVCDYFGNNLPPSFEKIRDEIIMEVK